MTFETIKNDMYAAMKAKDKMTKDVLSTLIANAKNNAIASGADRDNVPEDIVNKTILSEKKLLQKMIAEFPENATSKDHIALLQSYYDRLAIVTKYAPQIIDDENQIKEIIINSGIDIDKKNMGKLMGFLKGQKCDMGVANAVVKAMVESN